MLLRMLRQLAAVVSREFETKYASEVALQPGRLLFPKQVHDLGDLGPDGPDGLNIAYIRLAVTRNAAAAAAVPADTAVGALAEHVTRHIGTAVLLEREIVERLQAR